MTPEERNLVIDLFDRLGTLEDARRDPEAERLIRDGLRQAPNAVYSLAQTVLVQDEALKRADARIRELEDGAQAAPRDTSFLGSMRQTLGSHTASVPSVRAAAAATGVSPAWQANERPAASAQPQAAAAAAPAQSAFSGGSFLGTAAAAAAGMIGGSLLLSGIRSMMGHSFGNQSALGSFSDGNSPWSSGGQNSDLARSAGLDDIGRSASNDGQSSLFDSSDSNAQNDAASDADSFLGDGDMDLGSSSTD